MLKYAFVEAVSKGDFNYKVERQSFSSGKMTVVWLCGTFFVLLAVGMCTNIRSNYYSKLLAVNAVNP